MLHTIDNLKFVPGLLLIAIKYKFLLPTKTSEVKING